MENIDFLKLLYDSVKLFLIGSAMGIFFGLLIKADQFFNSK